MYLAGLTVAATVTGCSTRFTSQTKKKSNRKPNFVIFFTDDQGYNDVGCFGSPNIKTPNFDRMAGEGMRFADFYAQPVCGPSRAALMTGCYPIRIAEPENIKNQHNIMAPSEITIAELLKQQEYRTALIGKWHLAGQRSTGYKSELLPNGQGFDYFYGTPVHNGYSRVVDHKSFKTQLMRNSEMLKDALTQQDMDMLTQDYTREAVQFITENKDKPFFLYLAHNMPHVPLGASPKFRGRSKRGLYGDVIEELDWSMGQVLETLKKLDIDDNTLVIYMSDNGPWIESHLGDYGGSADPLRGWKMSAWEGGSRVPCIMRWPGKIPAGKTCNELTTTMDIYPTFAELAGQEVPNDRIIDGKNIWSLMTGKPKSQSPHKAYYYYNYLRLNAVRSGKWKLVLPRPAKPAGTGWSGRMIDEVKEVELYDLDKDISETTSVAGKYPDVVKRLLNLVSEARDDLGDYTHFGKGARYLGESPPERAWPPRKKKS
ncbi:MAG: sulfatase [Anaerohalosphaera sp.]|nr:sulfatase [Anaerohalosphaera sp.]